MTCRTIAAALIFSALPAAAEPPQVVADIPAVGALVQMVMGDLGQVHVLLPAGADAHHYQMRTSDARHLQAADLLVWIGPELTPWLERTSQTLSSGQTLGLLAQPSTHRRNFGETVGTAHDDDREESDVDPHAWLDPENGIQWVQDIAVILGRADPDNSDIYLANAENAAKTIAATQVQVQDLLADAHDHPFAVSHDAYGYFTDRFSLTPAVSLSLGDAATPSAARLTEFRQAVQDNDLICIFPEAQHDASLLASAIRGTGAELGQALNPSGNSHPFSPNLYTQILHDMGRTLAGCLASRPAKISR